MNMQYLFLVGRATKDAEALKSKNNKEYGKFSVAVNEYRGKEVDEKTTFYDVLVFGKSVDKVAEKVKKGDTVIVQGRPEANAYMSKKDKEPKASITVMAENWRVLK